MKRRALLMFAVIAVLTVGLVSPAMAETYSVKKTFVRLNNGVPGVLYEPDTTTPPATSKIAVLVMHTAADYLENRAGTELATRGYTVLCANTSSSKSGFTSDNDQDKMISEVSYGVSHLRKLNKKVVLLGHSGGGGLMASYQNIAENGPRICQGPEKIVKCPNTLAGLPPADGLMLLDSNLGLSGMTLFSIDPAVVSEENAQGLNPELDMFNPSNGFNPNGSTYSDKFISRFSAKAGQRMNQLIEKALFRLEQINAGKGRYSDDEPFIIPGANFKAANNRLFSQDLRLWSHTRNAWPLLRPDGTISTQIVYSVRVPENKASTSPSLWNGALTTTVRRFLSTFALRTNKEFVYDDDSLPGIDFKSSYSNPVDSVAGITKPLLQMGMTAHWEFFVAETIFENVNKNNTDKTLAYVEGATHGWTPCATCPGAPYGDTVKTLFNYVDGWLSKPGRFF